MSPAPRRPMNDFPRQRRLTTAVAPVLAPLLLAACAITPLSSAPDSTAMRPAERWHAPVPHHGQVADLQSWWAQFDDPLLKSLIESAQRISPTLAQAAARMADARAARVAAQAARWPALEAVASTVRDRQVPGAPLGTVASVGLQAAWEVDLFGALDAGHEAAQAQLASSQAGWHVARVSIAAEVAQTYLAHRTCEAHVQQAEIDAASRAQTAHLTERATAAGVRAPAAADLARASAAQAQEALLTRKAQCDLWVKALVALTAHDEPSLRADLARQTARLPQPQSLRVSAVPAQVLAQRPDLHAAAQDVLAASATASQANAQRWPRITLAGSIGSTHTSSLGVSADGAVWSVGPITVTFPLFDGGAQRARAHAAQVHHEATTSAYAARLRTAVQEVESALVTLDSTARREGSAQAAVEGFDRAYRATEASHRAGAASLFELEDARRSLVDARGTQIDLQHDRVLAWIALYRSMGGGWTSAQDAAPSEAAQGSPDARHPPKGQE